MELSKRLQAVADMVTCRGTVCDVGCDHGYVSIYLIQRGVCKKVIAMDVKTGPLQRAKEHIADYGLENYIETRLSDGLLQVKPGEADAFICAGMGGRLMQKIIGQSKETIEGMQEMILQPQSEVSLLRKFLTERGFVIAAEDMVWEEGKFYPIMRVSKEQSQVALKPEEMTEENWHMYSEKYGPWLLKKRHPVLRQFLQYELRTNMEIAEKLQQGRDGERTKRRLWQVQAECSEIAAVLQFMGETTGD